jgi:4-diphosphocytidyl-2-C-methyl-D-erythritol kinase
VPQATGRFEPSMPPIEERAPAKINLDLLITGRRPDGYHELDSLVVFGPPCDRLTFRADERLSLDVVGPFAGMLAGEPDNLVLRAAKRLAAEVGRAAAGRITLEKRIPVAAGLGGGSSDAAATLRGLNQLWQLGMSAADLAPLGLQLGADVPVCLHGRAARMRGIGERLDFVDGLPDLALLLVNPGQPVATAAVFGGLGEIPQPTADLGPPPVERAGLLAWLRARPNHLQTSACRLLPAIGAVLAALEAEPGCELARMSGSGASCFGLFRDRGAAETAAGAIGRAHPQWWLASSSAAAS